MPLRDSKTEQIRKAWIEVITGRRWSASRAVEQADNTLKLKDVIGTVTSGRQGILTRKG